MSVLNVGFFSFNGATSFQIWKGEYIERSQTGQHRFNGATSFQIWKAGVEGYRRDDDVASMGPHLFRYGKTAWQNISPFRVMLQWGHIFSDMESR